MSWPSPEEVELQLDHLAFLTAAGKPPNDPSAWLVGAVRKGYTPPKRFWTWRQARDLRRSVENAGLAGILEDHEGPRVAASEQTINTDAQRKRQLDAAFESFDEHVKASILHQARIATKQVLNLVAEFREVPIEKLYNYKVVFDRHRYAQIEAAIGSATDES